MNNAKNIHKYIICRRIKSYIQKRKYKARKIPYLSMFFAMYKEMSANIILGFLTRLYIFLWCYKYTFFYWLIRWLLVCFRWWYWMYPHPLLERRGGSAVFWLRFALALVSVSPSPWQFSAKNNRLRISICGSPVCAFHIYCSAICFPYRYFPI
jgi:hypothetical protein